MSLQRTRRNLIWLAQVVWTSFVSCFVAVISASAALSAPTDAEFGGASAPTVYQDEYITVRSGISQLGTQAVHVGDALSLIVDLEFDGREIQIENLNEDVFQRAFAGVRGIRLYARAEVTTARLSQNRARVMGRWRLQVVDCPNDQTSCPGSKTYELPTMAISYQLTDAAGGTADGRSARFRPWPGKIDVAPAIAVMPQAGMALTDVLPGGAYAKPLPVSTATRATSVLLIAGAMLLTAGLFLLRTKRAPSRVVARSNLSNSRWQQVLPHLRDDSMPDAQWSDLLRRCITWYCLDELHVNPYTYLGTAAINDSIDGNVDIATRELFLDVLHQHGVDPSQRDGYLERLLQVTGLVDAANSAGQAA